MVRFTVDAHVHALRFAANFRERNEKPTYAKLGRMLWQLEPFDNSERLLADMDRYKIDMAVIQSHPAWNMRNDMIAEIVKKNPDRFVALCTSADHSRKVYAKQAKFDIELIVEELEGWLATPYFKGIGEALLQLNPENPAFDREAMNNLRRVMDLVAKHKKVICFHTGPLLFQIPLRLSGNPIYIDDLALEYPEVPIIVGHMGVQIGWYEQWAEAAQMVCAMHENVYLETSQAWSELIERACLDPHIGPEKIMYGSDWGASVEYFVDPRNRNRSYAAQDPHKGPPKFLVDHFKWNLDQVNNIRMTEDDRALILGENVAKLFGLKKKSK
ncbi:MAG: amidohydrolase family protein [Thaumarchaeota archaeon]|nr:amidohydrolase family protein [Nitrososphaerota archaeon]